MTEKIKFTGMLVVLMFATYAGGQNKFFDCKIATKGEDFSFPIFSRAGDTQTTKNINQLLQLSELELLDGYQTNHIFEKISIDNGTIYGGKVDISWQILSNNSKLLSVMFHESSCGATCAYWVRYYNFNSGNGDLIQLKDLFTAEGFVDLKKKILQKRTIQFQKEIMKVDSTEREYLLDVLDCYENDNLHDYYIKDTSLFIDGENCLSKNQKFFDLDMITKFNLDEFKDYLNEYGKAVFGISSNAVSKYRSRELPQLYEGTIGSLKILFIINHGYKNEMSGIYAYLKHGRGISLEGELNNRQLTMTEYTDDYEANGYINVTFDDQQLNGIWTNKDRTKSLKLIARRR